MSGPNHYDVIRSPVITEKSTAASEQDKVIFKVARTATKGDIKAAVEALFKVKVKSVNTLVRKGKKKRFGAHAGRRRNWKKAYVSLKPGQEINFAAEA